ncbi:hypothetical protein [Burkholderia sp. MSMB1498]|uniref:hypothetical protein n=1 Tax=Burkholderia sp. MSMB1498 TaxID=1637842 RepID=UPI00075E54EA|nr:hypothetical protein [Burkholderia sp. MSMB1498]KVK76455.1 hypothetical protein WS91_16425 [Burkholderia sp. MSMB1498]
MRFEASLTGGASHEFHERFVYGREVFAPDAQAFEVMRPRTDAPDGAAGFAATASGRLAAAGGLRGDAGGVQ